MFDLVVYIEQIEQSESVEELASLLSEALSEVGVALTGLVSFSSDAESQAFVEINKAIGDSGSGIDLTTFDPQVLDQLQSIASSTSGAFSFEVSGGSEVKDYSLRLQSKDICIPLRGPGGSFAIACVHNQMQAQKARAVSSGYIDVIATAFYRKYCEIALTPPKSVRLTNKEVQVLRAVAKGETKRSIADLMGVTNHAIDFHYRNIMKKYRVSKIVVAVAKGIKEGVI